MANSSSSITISPRFTLELEFVLSLSNPYYLQHLATAYPHLFQLPTSSTENDGSKFAAYLKYLYAYWSTPEYSQFLTHPGAVLNTLKLLQEEQFRRDIIRPDVINALLRGGIKSDDGKDGVDPKGRELGQEGQNPPAVQEGNRDRMDDGAMP